MPRECPQCTDCKYFRHMVAALTQVSTSGHQQVVNSLAAGEPREQVRAARERTLEVMRNITVQTVGLCEQGVQLKPMHRGYIADLNGIIVMFERTLALCRPAPAA